MPTHPRVARANEADQAFDDAGHLGSRRVRDGKVWFPRPDEPPPAPLSEITALREGITSARIRLQEGRSSAARGWLEGVFLRQRDATFHALRHTQLGPRPASMLDPSVCHLVVRLRILCGVLGQSMPDPMTREDALGILLPPDLP